MRSVAAETTEIAGTSSRPGPGAAEEATTRTGKELGLSQVTVTADTLMVVPRAVMDRETGHRTVLGTDVEVVVVEIRAGDLEHVDSDHVLFGDDSR